MQHRLDSRGVEQRIVDQAVLYRPQDSVLVPGFEPGHEHFDAEGSEPRRLLGLVCRYLNLESVRGKRTRLQVLSGIEARASAQGCQQELRRSHALVATSVLRRLVADRTVTAGDRGKFYIP